MGAVIVVSLVGVVCPDIKVGKYAIVSQILFSLIPYMASLYTTFLYADFRQAIHLEEGERIIRHWRWWLPRSQVARIMQLTQLT